MTAQWWPLPASIPTQLRVLSSLTRLLRSAMTSIVMVHEALRYQVPNQRWPQTCHALEVSSRDR